MNSTQFIQRDQCPLCASRSAATHIAFEIPVVKCQHCGFIFSSKVLDDSTSHAYYQNQFGSQRHLQGQIINAKINAWALGDLIDIEEIGNLLDVGAGYGFFLDEVRKQNGIDVTGVELSDQEAVYAKRTLGVNVHNCALSQAGLARNHFDVVTCFEVIEHIGDPGAFIHELTQYVKPGGYLLVMTDNFESRMAKALGAGFPKWIPHAHISHFSSRTLTHLVQGEQGLRICKTKSYTPWEVLARAAYYRLRGIRKTPEQAFQLTHTLQTEMQGKYKFFALRRFVNKLWARLTLSPQMDGAMMFFVAKKMAGATGPGQ